MRRQTGFSLIELVVTITFIGISVAALLAFFTHLAQRYIQNQLLQEAIVLAQNKMEEIVTDRNNPDRDIDYVTTAGRYPSESINEYTISVTISNQFINTVQGNECTVTVSHPSLDFDYNIIMFFNQNNTLDIQSNNYFNWLKYILLLIIKLLTGG